MNLLPIFREVALLGILGLLGQHEVARFVYK